MATEEYYGNYTRDDSSYAEATFIQSAHKEAKISEKRLEPCHVGIHWIALAEYSQMSTMCQGYGLLLGFCIILYWPN